jgi:NADPH-dependent sulfite reductase flavoprotein alpha-component
VATRTEPATGTTVITRVAGDKLHPTNFGRLCTKGATHAEMMSATTGRLTSALMRGGRGEEPHPVATDTAVAEAGRRLRAIIDDHGTDAVSLYVSGQMSLEAQYLATKLAKGFLRTIHIESNSRLCMASAGTGLKQSLGSDGPPGSYTDFDCTNLFFVIGSNMADCHPILFLRMADRLKADAKLIVVDPRRTLTADRADLFLQIKPGTDLALLNGLLHVLVEHGAIDDEFIAEHTEGWDATADFLADYPPDRVAEITGLAEADIRAAAAMIAEARDWMTCWTMGLNQSTHGTWNTNAICNLHLATGAICRPGSGPMSLTGQPNAMGGREMGYMGPGLPGQRSVASPEDRVFVEAQWDLPPGTIRDSVGPGTIDMFRAMVAGDIKAAWIICTNPVATVANRQTVIDGLQAAELVITQDTYADTATNRYADIVLPATLWAETDAVMVNSDRNVTLLNQSLVPPGEARPDWALICGVADALGFGKHFAFKSSEEIFEEIRRFHNPQTGYDLRGASYQRLRRTPLQWPIPPMDAPGGDVDRHPIRYLNDGVSQHLHVDTDGRIPRLAFATPSRRAIFHPRPHMDPAELPDDEYPVVLNTGRLQHQWHTMTKTGRVDKLNKLNSGPFVEIHPDDAAGRGIVDAQPVEIASRRGTVVLPAVITDRVRTGNVWVPFHWNDEHGADLTINALTNDATDPYSLQPEFKVCAVNLRPVPQSNPPDAGGGQNVLRTRLGLGDVAPPTFTDSEKLYLSGFVAALAEQPTGVPVLPTSAPVREPVRLFVDGMLAGHFLHARHTEATLEAGPLVVWASQTGNAEGFAGRVAELLADAGTHARMLNMDDCALADLAAGRDVLVVTSTFGDGGPPDNGADFWARLQSADAPALDGIRYAVLGIGDRSYDNFCGHAKSLDARLADLGAAKLLDRAECEAYDEEPMAQWARQVTTLIGSPAAERNMAPAARTRIDRPFTRGCPVAVPLSRNTVLTGPGSAKEVRQFGFDISTHDVTYAVGDSLGVYPTNDADAVNRWLAAAALTGEEIVTIDGSEVSLRDAVGNHYDISRVTPDLLDFVAERCADSDAVTALRRNKHDLRRWLVDRNGVDIVECFPVRADALAWQDALVRLTPRNYSIASSPLVSPHEVQLTVSIVRPHGVCSTFLADRAAAPVPVFLQPAPNFKPPADPDTPMVMVGPGTGVAPFRGFLQERRALGHTGRNWLFFGDQHARDNFYYRDELGDLHRDGFLTRLDLAFSRDQPQRIYVQHKMIEAGAQLWSWLEDGARFYVCGDATRMAKDVDAALTSLIAKHGSISEEAAHAYKRELIADKRYVRDVY